MITRLSLKPKDLQVLFKMMHEAAASVQASSGEFFEPGEAEIAANLVARIGRAYRRSRP